MNSPQPSIAYLYDLQLFGIKAGLNNISRLLDFAGHPERSYPVLHIAGTNGKGSTAAMLASILTASGYRTGLYTSPHLVRFNERIRIDGREICDNDVVNYTMLFKPTIDRLKATFFEATTAMAFQYFADKKIDIAVIETGMGGRWDATNVVSPLLSIITTISHDHAEYLGTTLSRIAFEKGGIIKTGVPCLTSVEDSKAVAVLRRIAQSKDAPFVNVAAESEFAIKESTFDRLTIDVRSHSGRYCDLEVGLTGTHQAWNAQLALAAVDRLNTAFHRLPDKGVREGLCAIRRNTGLRGRLEILSSDPLVIADVGHNPGAVEKIANTMKSFFRAKLITVFGVMKDKDFLSMIPFLADMSRLVIAVTPLTDRAAKSGMLVEELHRRSVPALDGGSVPMGIQLALAERRKNEVILVAGSHYVVGEAFSIDIKKS